MWEMIIKVCMCVGDIVNAMGKISYLLKSGKSAVVDEGSEFTSGSAFILSLCTFLSFFFFFSFVFFFGGSAGLGMIWELGSCTMGWGAGGGEMLGSKFNELSFTISGGCGLWVELRGWSTFRLFVSLLAGGSLRARYGWRDGN